MTHNADCSVSEEGRAELNKIGACFSNAQDGEDLKECKVMAEEAGMSKLGEGVGRATYAAAPEGTDENGCVVKFGKSIEPERPEESGVHIQNDDKVNGTAQNEAEVRDWVALPEDIRDNFVPIRDFDEEFRWVSAARAEQDDISDSEIDELTEELAAHGWMCDDLRPDNVGTLMEIPSEEVRHDKPRMLDYGLDCGPEEEFELDVEPLSADVYEGDNTIFIK